MHPSLDSPLGVAHPAQHALAYEGATSGRVLRSVSHPHAWAAQPGGGLWGAVAASAQGGPAMRAQAALALAAVLPAEARLAYATLRHEAYQQHREAYQQQGEGKGVGEGHAREGREDRGGGG